MVRKPLITFGAGGPDLARRGPASGGELPRRAFRPLPRPAAAHVRAEQRVLNAVLNRWGEPARDPARHQDLGAGAETVHGDPAVQNSGLRRIRGPGRVLPKETGDSSLDDVAGDPEHPQRGCEPHCSAEQSLHRNGLGTTLRPVPPDTGPRRGAPDHSERADALAGRFICNRAGCFDRDLRGDDADRADRGLGSYRNDARTAMPLFKGHCQAWVSRP
jgi:hypothetical protein